MYWLTITFYVWMGGNGLSINSTTMPTPYNTIEDCKAAGTESATNYTGGAKLEFTCAPVGRWPR